jgi:COP9 signalosome complex subunit 8
MKVRKHGNQFSVAVELALTICPAYFQEKTLREVSHAYEAIRPAAAADYLGLNAAAAEQGDPAVIQKFTAVGWTWDETTRLLHPKPIPTSPEKDARLYNELSQIMALVGKHGG